MTRTEMAPLNSPILEQTSTIYIYVAVKSVMLSNFDIFNETLHKIQTYFPTTFEGNQEKDGFKAVNAYCYFGKIYSTL
jgi:hypothetical protein